MNINFGVVLLYIMIYLLIVSLTWFLHGAVKHSLQNGIHFRKENGLGLNLALTSSLIIGPVFILGVIYIAFEKLIKIEIVVATAMIWILYSLWALVIKPIIFKK